MRKLIVCVLMLGALVVFTGAVTPGVQAQAKKEKDKDTKSKDVGVIEVAEGKDGKFRFFVRSSDGKLLAMSSPGGFATEKDAAKAIDELKDVLGKAKVTAAKKDTKKDKDKDKATKKDKDKSK